MKIGIAKTTRNGLCSDTCPLFSPSCPLMADDEVQPGPSCPGPGVYVLVPETEEKALRELAEAVHVERTLIAIRDEDAMMFDAAGARCGLRELSAAVKATDAALARLRALSSPGIPDNSKGGGK